MRIIPAIDILHGKCVRLTQGDFAKAKIYNEEPLTVALQFQDADLEYLHLVDLEGAKKGKVINWDVITELQEKTALQIDFGGGVKTEEDVERLLELDINQINIGSLAITEPEKFTHWLDVYGAENFILGADVRDENIMINGWLEAARSIRLAPLRCLSAIMRKPSAGSPCSKANSPNAMPSTSPPSFAIARKSPTYC